MHGRTRTATSTRAREPLSFALHTSKCDGGDPEQRFSAWEAGEPTNHVVFQAQMWPFEGAASWLFWRVGARRGPEQLIKIANADVANAYYVRPQPMPTMTARPLLVGRVVAR